MLTEKRLQEIGQLAYADHKTFGGAGQALAATRLGLRELLPELERLRRIEESVRVAEEAVVAV